MRSLFLLFLGAFAFTTASAQLSVNCIVEAKIPCAGARVGSFRVDVKGGTPPYQYTWSNPKLEGRKPRNVATGSYTVTVKDAKGKTGSATGTLSEPPFLIIFIDEVVGVSEIGSRDGRVRIEAKGGTSPFAYKWNNGADTQTMIGLEAGKYTVTVTDDYNCRAKAEINIEAPTQAEIPEIVIGKASEPESQPKSEAESEPQSKPEPMVSIEEVKPETTLAVGQVIQVEKLYFKADAAEIKEESYPVLDEIYNFLTINQVVVEIGGHTNSIPTDEYCFKLSNSRAKTVAEYLYSRGIPEPQVSYKGYGKTEPIADNATYQGRQKNQRVEIKVLSVE